MDRNICPAGPLQKLDAGVYSCPGNHCHINLPELLRANGFVPTRENIELMTIAAAEICSKIGRVEIHED
jgi:hypothetical protein